MNSEYFKTNQLERKFDIRIRMNNESYTNNTVKITQIALFSALQCVISPFAIVLPFSPVPISLATLMLYISIYILGKKNSIISCGIYLLIGLIKEK